MNTDHIDAHKHSIRHREQIIHSQSCGCFYCLQIFLPTEVKRWIDDGETSKDQTALCPNCGIDAVIGSQSGFPIEPQFLKKMHDYWF